MVPGLLWEAGLRLLTLSEHYGIPANENVPDENGASMATACSLQQPQLGSLPTLCPTWHSSCNVYCNCDCPVCNER